MWTTEQIRHYLDTRNVKEITNRMDLYQKEICTSNSKSDQFEKSCPHFLLAFSLVCTSTFSETPEYAMKLIELFFNNTPEVKKVLPFIKRPQTTDRLNSKDLTTLYQLYCGLEMLVFFQRKEVVDMLFTKYNFDFNFVLPKEQQHIGGGDLNESSDPLPLIFRVLLTREGREGMAQFLLHPKYNVDVNKQVNGDVNKGVTLLYCALTILKTSISNLTLQMLIDRGADPYLPLTINHPDPEIGEVNTTLYEMLEISPKMRPQFEKLKQCLQNKKPVVEGGYSSEHSSGSGSNSPMSLTPPNGSPPHPSVMVRHSPPDSPEGSRKGSPPGSPMHTSDNSSSGSAGTSPEKLAVVPASSYQFSIPPGNGDLVHEFHEALKKNRLQDARTIYDTGRVKPDCYCEPCKINALHWIMTSHEYKDMKEFVLRHPKYPANINSINRLGETVLHILVSWDFMTGKGISAFVRNNKDKNLNLDIKDNDGNTPLHISAMSGGKNSHEVVEELLKHGANPTITNSKGLTARELCVQACPKEDVKKKVLAVFDEQLNPYQKQHPSVPAPLAAPVRETSSAAPIIYTGGNKVTMFSSQNSASNGNSLNVVSLPPAAAHRADAKSVGALYAPPPQASIELPKRVAKEEPAAAASRTDTKKSLGDRVKNLFHIK